MKERWQMVWVALGAAFVGWMAGGSLGYPWTLESTLVGVEHRRLLLQNQCFEDLQNQFTPGYKAHVVVFDAKDEPPQLSISQGMIFQTQSPTDLAINGVGFFVLEQDRYTRDGRFTWKEGRLELNGRAVQGFPLDSLGNLKGDLGPIKLGLDPQTKLYEGRYSSYHFDNNGRLYGESAQTDPVTGQEASSETPLYQLALATFENPQRLASNGTCLRPTADSGKPVLGVAGQGCLGQVAAGSLEGANVDFMAEGMALQVIGRGRISLTLQAPAPAAPTLKLPQARGILGNGGHLDPPSSQSRFPR